MARAPTPDAASADTLGAALAEEVLAELRAPATPERDAYLGVMVTALKAHILRGPGDDRRMSEQ